MAAAHDLTLWGLFLQADLVVKSVMVLLVMASLICWTIIGEKIWRFRELKRAVARLEHAAADPARAFEDLTGPVSGEVLAAGKREVFDQDDERESRSETRERIERAMRAVMGRELRKLEIGLPFLATVGSTAPFIGLFGTVWGIMNSFTAIAAANNTSLTVVAPGIAEALFATAIGLFAAIPSVIGYNKLVVDLGRAAQRMSAAIGEIGGRMVARPRHRGPRVLAEAAN